MNYLTRTRTFLFSVVSAACIALFLALVPRFEFSTTISKSFYKIGFPTADAAARASMRDFAAIVTPDVLAECAALPSELEHGLSANERVFEVTVHATRQLTMVEALKPVDDTLPISNQEFFEGLERAFDSEFNTRGTRVRTRMVWASDFNGEARTTQNSTLSEETASNPTVFLNAREEVERFNSTCPHKVNAITTLLSVELLRGDSIVYSFQVDLPPDGRQVDWPGTLSDFRTQELEQCNSDAECQGFLKMGFNLVFQYSTPSEGLVGEYTISQNDFDEFHKKGREGE